MWRRLKQPEVAPTGKTLVVIIFYMRTLIWTLVISIFLFSCGSEKTEDRPVYNFHKFLRRLAVLKLPFEFRPQMVEGNELIPVEPKDTAFLKSELAFYYGLLSDTTNFYGIITIAPADDYIPVLTTFDKNGKFIESRDLIVRGCADDACIKYCSSTTIIKNDYSIFSVDSIIAAECDSLNEEISGTDSLFRNFFYGHINANGKIEIGEEKMDTQKNNNH